jgi:hypothetical protein
MMMSWWVGQKFHLVMTGGGDLIAVVPWRDDPNHGLPDWFFDNAYVDMTVDLEKDTIEWVPECGPAPCWEAPVSSFASTKAMFDAWHAWARKMY